MPSITPWSEFVANPELSGMLLEVQRSKSVGNLWGKVRSVEWDEEFLTIHLLWTAKRDPRKFRGERTEGVESLVIKPEHGGAVYTRFCTFAVRDLLSGMEHLFHCTDLRVPPKTLLPEKA